MNQTETDAGFMSQALQLAEKGCYSTHPNPRAGCVFVRDGQVIAQGWHVKAGAPHAEINAIQSAQSSLTGSSCYVTLEPCNHTGKTPPCTTALLASGVARVVVATPDPNPLVSGRGIAELQQAGVIVETGLLAEQARQLNRGFFSRMQRHRPFVTCKLAISLDGKVALGSGESKWISTATARQDVQQLRARSSAVLTGINTVLADDPRLNVRDVDTGQRQPLRVVLDRRFRLPVTARLLGLPGQTLVIGQGGQQEATALQGAGAVVEQLEGDDTTLLRNSMTLLAEKYQINDLLVEAGPTLAGALLKCDLIDELVIYQNPSLLGNDAIDMINIPVLNAMDDRMKLELLQESLCGVDRRLVFKVKKSSPQARARARRNAVQALYQWLLTGAAVTAIIAEFEDRAELNKADKEYFYALLSGCEKNAADLEQQITPCLDRQLERLDPVERAILLVGAYELAHRPGLPVNVVINEAIELAKVFGAEGSYKYINGVMDKLAGALR
ncbi:MAG: bifunctional diaminohydroxyphosphoribosylaminopyrimidine deaminase/5-amino-6-(5-phosphoribosylamino)uracil reductase RibD [Gammaproteobacteria bacterium]